MTEIEQLRADLETLRKAVQVSSDLGFPAITVGIKTICSLAEKKIADLEAQQAQADEWADSRIFVQEILADSSFPQRLIWLARYARHLESKVAELSHELRCERIAGGKVRDDLKARIAEMEQHGLKVDQANHEHYGRLQDQIAIRDLKIEKLERQAPAERNREKLAELTTIQNAIPPACGLARELVERRIEGVKKEMQR